MTITTDPNAAPEPTHGKQWSRIFAVLAAGAAGMAALLALFPAAGHDQLWFLMMARRWMGGAQLYGPEIFDSNPPGVVWLSALAVGLGKLLHAPATAAGKLLVALAAAGSLRLAYVLLPGNWRPLRRYERWALLFAAVVLLSVVPARDFGQRDHLAGFLLLPYVLASVRREEPGRAGLRALAAGTAAVAICLKPHYALVAVVVELCALLVGRPGAAGQVRRRRWPGLEVPVLLFCGLAFLLAVWRFAPLYFEAALPVTRSVYWAIGHLSVAELAWQAVEMFVLWAVALALFLASRQRSRAVFVLLMAGQAAGLAYMVQGTGWYYQQLPAITLFGAALALELLDIFAAKPRQAPSWLPGASAFLVVLALGLTTHFTGYPFTPDRSFAIETPDPAIFSRLAPGTAVATLTTSVDEAMMPVERYGLTWAQRTNNLWLMPAILREEDLRRHMTPQRLAALDAMQHRWMVEDLRRWRPALVLVERCQQPRVQCQELEDRDDDLLAWFLRDPAFAAEWQNYAFAERRGRFDVYGLREAATPAR